MTLKERVRELCKDNGTSLPNLESELGFGSGTISRWDKSYPSVDKLKKIADHFEITIDDLVNESEGLTTCKECGLTYDSCNTRDIREHQREHSAWLKAIKKFGNLYCHYPEREKIKAEGRNDSHNISLPLPERCNAQIRVLRCLFSRSVQASGYNLEHVSFDAYVSMMLDNEGYRKNLDDDLFEALCNQFGTLPGIDYGSYYNVPESKTSLSEITHQDERDIKKDLNNLMEKLNNKEYGPAAYDGEELSPEAAELFKDELEIALRRLKLINKEKYTPKKFKK